MRKDLPGSPDSKAGELSLLDEIAAAISSTLSTEEINRMIVERLIERMDVEQGYVTLLDEGDQETTQTVVRVIDEDGRDLPMRLGFALTGWLLTHEEPLLSNEAQTDERFSGMDLKGQPIRSVLAVPLMVRSRMIGFLALFNRKSGQFTEQESRLLSIVATHSAQVLEAARLYEGERRLQVLEDDMRAARTIQRNLLPRSAPEVPGFDLAGLTVPAKEVGGDYFDFISLPEGRWGIVLGDVCGKGLPAAMLMANLQATLRSQAPIHDSAANCVAGANRLICSCVESGKFVTLLYSVLEPSSGRLDFCSAGHTPPILFRQDGSLERPDAGGLVLGILPGTPYEGGELRLESGDLLVLFSDGVTEARRSDGEEFEEDRLLDILRRHRTDPAEQIVQAVAEAVSQFQSVAGRFDDLTVVVLKAG